LAAKDLTSGRIARATMPNAAHTFPPLFFIPEWRGDGQKQNL
jgi:hypothetical protein